MTTQHGTHIDTLLAQTGSWSEGPTGAVNFPVYHAAVYRHPGLGESTGFDYARAGNPTRKVLEEAIAKLEGGIRAFACSSGMAAFHTLFSLLKPGDHVLFCTDLYGGTYRFMEEILRPYGIQADYVDTSDTANVERAMTPATRACFVETPSNPLLRITDIRRVADICKSHGAWFIVDNTLLTPYLQRPLELGADIVLHSATKYLGGHNDVLAGLIVVNDVALAAKLEQRQMTIGAVLGPQDCWLLMRGMKTLAVRMARHQETALKIAHFLRGHHGVKAVYYPGFADHPGHDVQVGQASGFSGLLSFRLKDHRLVAPLLKSLELISFAESLGGTETLLTFPMQQTHKEIPADLRAHVDRHLMRLSVGLEHPDDLIGDLTAGFERALAAVEGEASQHAI